MVCRLLEMSGKRCFVSRQSHMGEGPPDGLPFNELLKWHMTNGTRPRSDPRRGVEWGPKELADRIGCTDKTVRNWRNGKSRPDSTETIERIFFGNNDYYPFAYRLGLRDARDNAEQENKRRKETKVTAVLDGEQLDKPSKNESHFSDALDTAKIPIEELVALSAHFQNTPPEQIHERHLGGLINQVTRRRLKPHDYDYAVFAYRKLCEDLKRSVLSAPRTLLSFNQVAQTHLNLLLDAQEKRSAFALIEPEVISGPAWRGKVSSATIHRMKNIAQSIGRKPRLSVGSACSAACAVAVWLNYLDIPIEIDTRDASGREHARRLTKTRALLPDFAIGADAPIVISIDKHELPYSRRLDIHSEHQALLRKKGGNQAKIKTIFLYPSSSASLQLKATYALLKERFDRNKPPHEIPIELSDYPRVAENLAPGDAMFAWSPLLERLAYRFKLEPQVGTDFSHFISLYQLSDWDEEAYQESAEAFVDGFIAVWNNAVRHPLKYWLALISHPAFLENFSNSVVDIHDQDHIVSKN